MLPGYIPRYERFDEINGGVPGHDTFGTQRNKRNKIFFFVGLTFVFCLLVGSTVLIGEFLKDYPGKNNNWNGSPDLFGNVDRGNTTRKTRRAVPEDDHVSDSTVYDANVSDSTVYDANVSDSTTPSHETTCITGIIKTVFCLSYRQVHKAYDNCFGTKNATYHKDYINFNKTKIIYPRNVTDYWCD